MVVRKELLRLLGELVEGTKRPAVIQALSERLGVDTFIVFLADPEIGTLLSAPGFPQTFPERKRWRQFLEACRTSERYRDNVPWPTSTELTPAVGLRAGDKCVLVLLGGNPKEEDLEELAPLLPLIATGLASERELASKAVQSELAQQTAREAATLAVCLDEARRAAQKEIVLRRQVEAALRETKDQLAKTNEELEQRVEERTSRLKETIAELEAFSYSISHDMRAPLRAMQGYAEALMEDSRGKLDSESRDHLDRIARASRRLDALINDVLRYTRVARCDAVLTPLPLGRLVRDVIDQYPQLQRPVADFEIHGPLPDVLGHEVLLVQCLSNLFINAVKFVPSDRRPHVCIRTETTNQRVRLWIEDNGIGIAPENFQRIFGMFERINPEQAFDGTGIGLAIVKRAVARMRGSVGVKSTLGRGTTFWVELEKV